MLYCFLACIPITPLLASLFVVDAGSVLKVVSITQENWSTEEVVLEELQVFQVLCSTKLHTSTNIGLLLFPVSTAFWLVMVTVLQPCSVGQLIIGQNNPSSLRCTNFNELLQTHLLSVIVIFIYLQVPTPILSMEMSSKQVRPHSPPFYSHTHPTLLLHMFSAHIHATCIQSCVYAWWGALLLIANSFMYSVVLCLSSSFLVALFPHSASLS